jgi:hypothetical protein
MFDEQTPKGRKRVLIFGWAAIAVAVLLTALLVLSIRPLEDKPADSQNTNIPSK